MQRLWVIDRWEFEQFVLLQVSYPVLNRFTIANCFTKTMFLSKFFRDSVRLFSELALFPNLLVKMREGSLRVRFFVFLTLLWGKEAETLGVGEFLLLGILQAVTLYFSPFFAGEKWRDLWLAILAGSGEKNKKAGRGQCDSPDIGESPLICRFGGESLPPKTARNGEVKLLAAVNILFEEGIVLFTFLLLILFLMNCFSSQDSFKTCCMLLFSLENNNIQRHTSMTTILWWKTIHQEKD
jgi:hypothetical protein